MSGTGLVISGEWAQEMLVMVTASGAIVVLADWVFQRLIAKMLAAFACGLALNWLVLVLSVTHSDVIMRLPPYTTNLELLEDYFREVVLSSWYTVPPAADVALFAPAITCVMSLLALCAFILALIADSCVGATGLLAAPWLIIGFLSHQTPLGWAFAFAAACLILLASQSRSAPDAATWQAAKVALAAALAAVSVGVTYLCLPLLAQLPGYGAALQAVKDLELPGGGPGPGPGTGTGSGRDIWLYGDVDLGKQLSDPDTTPRFQVRGNYRGYLKLVSFYEFTGTGWSSSGIVSDTLVEANVPLWPADDGAYAYAGPELSLDITTALDNQESVYRLLLVGPRVMVNPPPVTGYSAPLDSLTVSATGLRPGAILTQRVPGLDTSLLTSTSTAPSRPNDYWTNLATSPSPNLDLVYISQVATSVTSGHASQHDKLMALVNYLNGPHFEYTLTPQLPANGRDPVSAFLEDGDGYCVQFATALAVMGRSIGIPMRVAGGYLQPGGADDEWRDISAAEAHLWAEAYFPGTGWVPYEATKSRSGGQSASPSATPSASASQSAANSPSTSISGATSSSPTVSATNGSTGAQTGSLGDWRIWAGIGTGAAVGAGAVSFGFAWRRRRCTTERAWGHILRRARSQLRPADDETVRQSAARLKAAMGYTPDTQAARLALDALVAQLEAERYGPPPASQFEWREAWHTVKVVSDAVSAHHAA
jgi:transglutaminase-like putative cysteine protease